jgi:diguanylate cyclase (GGDEF)-like protein
MRAMFGPLRQRLMPPVPEAIRDDFTLLRAKRVESQTPMMYLMLLATTPTAAWAGDAAVHWPIRYGLPAVLALVCVLGMIENWQSRQRRMSLRRARIIVDRTAKVSGSVGVMCSIWCITNWVAAPPANHSAFAMILTMGSLATAYCLSAIRFAAILNLVIGVVPIALLMLLSGVPVEMAAATSLLLGTAILVRFILQGHSLLVDMLQLQEQMRNLAHTDPLTGLANRRALDDKVAALVRPRTDERPFRLVLLDLNGFKPINDQYGHAVGDKLLCSVAKRLNDHVGKNGMVARQGGDEFAVLIPPGSPLLDLPIADHLLSQLARPHAIDGIPVHVGASIGVAEWPLNGVTDEQLFDFADRALYGAKAMLEPAASEVRDRDVAA